MRIALVTNALEQPARGNHTTVQRWLHHARGTPGLTVDAVPSEVDQVFDPVPDLFHGYHAMHGGTAARELARKWGRPYVVSLGGTDLYALMRGGQEGDEVADVLLHAACVTGAFDSFGTNLRARFRDRLRYVTVPRGCSVPPEPAARPPNGIVQVLLAAGLQPDKDPLLAIELAEELDRRGVPVHLRILGPELDAAYAYRVRARAERLDFVTMGEVPFEGMPAEYERADVVWNTSFHEGGANTLLEAIACGCTVIVRDVPGNRDFALEEGSPVRVLARDDPDGFEAFHRSLLRETFDERRQRIECGHAWLRRFHDPHEEVRLLVALWQREGK